MHKILILGGTGMLGHTLFNYLSSQGDLEVYATVRTSSGIDRWFVPERIGKILTEVDADHFDTVIRALAAIRPEVVINCIGLIKQLPLAGDPLSAIAINALFPHRLALICRAAGARMIHISTDCVFDGRQGNYGEGDPTHADDLYGRSKMLGEVVESHCVTLRTSMIGHELAGRYGLVEWFLSQTGKVQGFTRAIYTGFPTIELAAIIKEHVLPYPELQGVCHVSSDPISKYDLLGLIAKRYEKQITIEPAGDVRIDRSLNSTRFRTATGYRPPPWPELVERMYRHYRQTEYQRIQQGDKNANS